MAHRNRPHDSCAELPVVNVIRACQRVIADVKTRQQDRQRAAIARHRTGRTLFGRPFTRSDSEALAHAEAISDHLEMHRRFDLVERVQPANRLLALARATPSETMFVSTADFRVLKPFYEADLSAHLAAEART